MGLRLSKEEIAMAECLEIFVRKRVSCQGRGHRCPHRGKTQFLRAGDAGGARIKFHEMKQTEEFHYGIPLFVICEKGRFDPFCRFFKTEVPVDVRKTEQLAHAKHAMNVITK